MADLDYKSASTAAAGGSGAGKPKDPRTPNPGTTGGGDPKRKVSLARVVVAVLAAALVAFCAWSMSQYAQGRDPLAFASGSVEESGKSALLSAGKTDSSSSSAKASGKDAAKAKQIDKDTVTKALASLKLGKTDLAVTKDVTVVVTKDGIWVEHVSSATGESLVTDTSRQALALAKWVARQGGIAKVTWVEEDSTGVVRMSVTISSKAAAGVSKKDAATILSAASGYAIDKDTYSLLKQPSFSAEKGKATLPGGGTITVGSEATSKAEATSSSSSSASGSNNGTSNGSDSNSSSDITTGEKNGGANSASGNQSPAKPTAGKMTVSVSINGSSHRVSLSQGATAYDALLATGASVSSGAYPGGGTWVTAINGLGEDASHGWTYKVNGSMPNVMSDRYTVHDGDSVVWSYVAVGQ
ncbi:DUF4430 domain-containing protein [Parafannyhessea umbonata]|uniref:DUF4430 domain-containing protein n=1 Tax=Parafannyhessea umbonata TaxID=604330 RepID=UPI003F9B9E13